MAKPNFRQYLAARCRLLAERKGLWLGARFDFAAGISSAEENSGSPG
jgi:hypothetical protein